MNPRPWRTVTDHADLQISLDRPQRVAAAGSYPARYWRDPVPDRRSVAKCPKCHADGWAHLDANREDDLAKRDGDRCVVPRGDIRGVERWRGTELERVEA